MPELRFALLGEGNSDDALLPLIQWTLEQPPMGLLPSVDIVPIWIDRHLLSDADSEAETIAEGLDLFPCNLLFIHRDADDSDRTGRAREIESVISTARLHGTDFPPSVPVVPVRALEAWFLIDESAIRRAANRPRGRIPLRLPRGRQIEAILDPKDALRQALRSASEKPRRRWPEVDRIRPRAVADQIRDFAPLRQLPAFQAFEADVRRVIAEQGWPERLG
jgi:hypothetical protein